MKVKDLITSLMNCPMDDEVKVLVTINGTEFSGEIGPTRRQNANQRPHTVIESSLDLKTEVSLEEI